MGTIKSSHHIAGMNFDVEATIGDGPHYVSYVCPECSRLKAEVLEQRDLIAQYQDKTMQLEAEVECMRDGCRSTQQERDEWRQRCGRIEAENERLRKLCAELKEFLLGHVECFSGQYMQTADCCLRCGYIERIRKEAAGRGEGE